MSTENKTVLLIEDDTFIREMYQLKLGKSGLNILTAADGEEGLKQASSKPDLILLDILLPRMHGLEVLKRLKASPETSSIPVILLSNLGQENIIKEAFSIGANGYFMKLRMTPEDLLKNVQEFLKDPTKKMKFEDLNF